MKDLKQCRILLVDDVKSNINILVDALKDDYQLGFALNGPSALKFVQAKNPDLILLDVMMPEMNGFEVCRHLKEDPQTRDIPVIFLTALDEIKFKTAGFEAGAVDFITKPFEVMEVKARVNTHLSLKLAHAELEKQRDRMQQSLDLAMEVQQGLLPSRDPVIDGFDIAGRSIYCDETGGDYYDYLNYCDCRPHRFGVVVGDVAEHGIQSALLMTTVRAFLRQRCNMPGSLSEVIADVNRQFTRDMEDSGRFMTLFFCELDIREKILRWVRAGHDPAFVYQPDNDSFLELTGRGLPLGILEDGAYAESALILRPGQVLVLGTDGIWESRNPEQQMFGKNRLRQIIRRRTDRPAKEILDSVFLEVDGFSQGLAREDDATMVVVKVL